MFSIKNYLEKRSSTRLRTRARNLVYAVKTYTIFVKSIINLVISIILWLVYSCCFCCRVLYASLEFVTGIEFPLVVTYYKNRGCFTSCRIQCNRRKREIDISFLRPPVYDDMIRPHNLVVSPPASVIYGWRSHRRDCHF